MVDRSALPVGRAACGDGHRDGVAGMQGDAGAGADVGARCEVELVAAGHCGEDERSRPGCSSHHLVNAAVHSVARPKSEISWQASIIEQ